MINKEIILQALNRVKPYINFTPVIESKELNKMLGHKIIFKAESLQVTGAFKVRGVLNTLLSLKEENILPKKIVAYSSGNHARAIAWATNEVMDIEAEIYMHKSTSISKQNAIKALGANLVITETRIEAEQNARKIGNLENNYFMHPSDNDLVITGAATLAYETFGQINETPDAIFAACGGGALLSGTYLGTKAHGDRLKAAKIFACEPSIANDASRSFNLGKIVGFEESPLTIADGLRTLKVSERTFKFLQQLDGFIEVSEEEIRYWTAWLHKLLSIPCEPTAAIAMSGAFNWLKLQQKPQTVLVILSGGNLDSELNIDSELLLKTPPKL